MWNGPPDMLDAELDSPVTVVGICESCREPIRLGEAIIREENWMVHDECLDRWERRHTVIIPRPQANHLNGKCDGCDQPLHHGRGPVVRTPWGTFHYECWADWECDHTEIAEVSE